MTASSVAGGFFLSCLDVILRNVLRGLAALHAQGFIHGDIKPTNIMLNIQGAVKLVDFGRACDVFGKAGVPFKGNADPVRDLLNATPEAAKNWTSGDCADEAIIPRMANRRCSFTERLNRPSS